MQRTLSLLNTLWNHGQCHASALAIAHPGVQLAVVEEAGWIEEKGAGWWDITPAGSEIARAYNTLGIAAVEFADAEKALAEAF